MRLPLNNPAPKPVSNPALASLASVFALFIAALFAVTGCSTEKQPVIPPGAMAPAPAMTNLDALTLREGDTVNITFLGASSSLDGSHTISRDGNITMKLIGEIKAAGKTIPELKADLLKAYSGQIDTKEITVELVSSAFPVYVTGAVLQPGKVISDHPMTALEAIMERGGFDYSKANLKSVEILRQDGSKLKSYNLNMKKVLEAQEPVQFYLKPYDIIYVRERFVWF